MTLKALGRCEADAHGKRAVKAVGTVYHGIWDGDEVEPSSGYPIALCAKHLVEEMQANYTISGLAVDVRPLKHTVIGLK